MARGAKGLVEIARHRLSTPGHPQILDEHYPRHPGGNGPRPPRIRPDDAEAEIAFCALGDGAERWLGRRAAIGAARIRSKMAQAVELAALVGAAPVDRGPGHGRPGRALRRRRPGLDPRPPRAGASRLELMAIADEPTRPSPAPAAWDGFGR